MLARKQFEREHSVFKQGATRSLGVPVDTGGHHIEHGGQPHLFAGAVEQAEVLQVTCGVEFGLIAVSQWISDYLRRYPQMGVGADLTGRVVDLVHEGFDLAIGIGTLADPGLAARKLGDIHDGLYAAPDYLAGRGLPTHTEALASHELLHFSGGTALTHWVLSQGVVSVRVALAVRDATQAGLRYLTPRVRAFIDLAAQAFAEPQLAPDHTWPAAD